MATRYVTRDRLKRVLADAQIDLEDLDLGQLLDDAQKLFAMVDESPWVTEAALRTEAEAAGITPDRANAAMKVLRSTDRVAAVSLTAKQVPQEPEAEPAPAPE